MIKRIESKDGELILIRPFSLRDLGKLQQMNSRISAETRRSFRAAMPQPRPPVIQTRRLMLWGLVEMKLALSSIVFVRQFLAFIPRMAYIAFVAVNSRDEVIGFYFFNILGRKAKHDYIAEAGIVITDDYQGSGIGPGLSAASLAMVDDKVLLVLADVYEWNHKAVALLERHGYKTLGTYRSEDGEAVRLTARGRRAGLLQPEGVGPSRE
jgi:RimJ/RimL family protein N-acetyltransferase